MPKTTVKLSMSSLDLTSSAFSVATSFNLTTDGTAGLDESTGLVRKKVPASSETLIASSDFSNSGESQLGYVYIRNFSTNASSVVFADSIAITVGTQKVGHLAGGQSAIIPFSADGDFKVTADTADTIIEYMYVNEG
jgi:hypothetical protein